MVVSAVVRREASSGARRNDVGHELWAQIRVDVLIGWNDGLAIAHRVESFVAAVRVETAPSCRNFRLALGPHVSGIHATAEGLMGSARVPCAGTSNRRTFVETRFNWWLQVSLLARATVSGVAFIRAARSSPVIGSRPFGVPVLAQRSARFNAARACSVAGARVARQFTRILRLVGFNPLGLERVTLRRIRRVIAFRWIVVQALLDVRGTAFAVIVGASVGVEKLI